MVPARVFGYVAAEADVCVLLRRGPSRQVLMIRWDLATDEFEIGQWLKGRVYEARSGLSPDGRLFAYFATDWSLRRGDDRGSYVALSRPPFFTALALWHGSGTHIGGAYWTAHERLSLNVVGGLAKGSVPQRIKITPLSTSGALWWQTAPTDDAKDHPSAPRPGDPIRTAENHDRLNGGSLDADWADVDPRGRLLLARAGRVFVRDGDGEREVIDLNPFEFRPLAPPEWATEWPE